MSDFQQKKQFKKIFYSKMSFVILFVLVIFLAKATYNIYKKSQLSADNYAETKRDYESLKARKEMLESEIGRLKTDNGVEEEIRSKFNVAKPGETVVVVINGSSSSSTDAKNYHKSFWSSFLEIFQ